MVKLLSFSKIDLEDLPTKISTIFNLLNNTETVIKIRIDEINIYHVVTLVYFATLDFINEKQKTFLNVYLVDDLLQVCTKKRGNKSSMTKRKHS